MLKPCLEPLTEEPQARFFWRGGEIECQGKLWAHHYSNASRAMIALEMHRHPTQNIDRCTPLPPHGNMRPDVKQDAPCLLRCTTK
ncbi:hypothetical protein GW17_00040226 [Ensete ventricosum]|nr:hypothetical protein GW17_00040226 [Ensete ventricosum]